MPDDVVRISEALISEHHFRGADPEFKKYLKIDVTRIIEYICHPFWHKGGQGFQDALQAAQQNNFIILASFTDVANCYPCRSLKAEVFDTCEFGFWKLKNRLVLVDLDRSYTDPATSALWTKYNIMGWPTVLALNPDGSERGRVVGYISGSGEAAWVQLFNQYLP